jgi:hypothetical protein
VYERRRRSKSMDQPLRIRFQHFKALVIELNTANPTEAICCFLDRLLELNKELVTEIGRGLMNSVICNLLQDS